jgi:hypothetical protein
VAENSKLEILRGDEALKELRISNPWAFASSSSVSFDLGLGADNRSYLRLDGVSPHQGNGDEMQTLRGNVAFLPLI